jgi:hypothetical protein
MSRSNTNIANDLKEPDLNSQYIAGASSDWGRNSACNGHSARIKYKALWPEYFARLGQKDSTTWHYQGYLKDTFVVWRAFYSLMLGHPVIAFIGMRHFFQSLIYRISDEKRGRYFLPIITILTPILMLLSPIISLFAVAIAPGFLKYAMNRLVPPLFRPFKFMGWANYNVMLITMFSLHGYKQYRGGVHPSIALKHSSKLFWHHFFDQHLPAGHRATHQLALIESGKVKGDIPQTDIVIKPIAGGAGYNLRTMRWERELNQFRCIDIERAATEKELYSREELRTWIGKTYDNGVIEKLEHARKPFPISSIRILTLNLDRKSQLLSAAMLPAPEGSNSTAYFDLDTYLIDYEHGAVGTPARLHSDGQYTGIEIPELNGIIETCLNMHDELPYHVEISWDVLLTDDGPVYLEGNVFPPGCDYKISIFKKYENFVYLRDRLCDQTNEGLRTESQSESRQV